MGSGIISIDLPGDLQVDLGSSTASINLLGGVTPSLRVDTGGSPSPRVDDSGDFFFFGSTAPFPFH